MSKFSLKGKLAVGFGVFLAAALAFLGMIALSVTFDAGIIAAIIFVVNASLHFAGGFAYLGVYKTVAYSFVASLTLRAIKFVRAVLA